ncbi:site-specific integrase [Conexibacter sp. DBS9H8]|uniref:site-specific integrase n=1 Tax=Conexibacter sp. DBS9H8 TaxID=2937801 RepID=UPI00200C2449|nr:site-specific integrase [Conexibacter sp. DBS9H8]
MRRGEILGLRWADVDLDAARLSIRHALVAVGYEVIESTPKSHNARVVDLDAETVTQLRRYRRAQQEERKLWGAAYEDQGLLVCKENGEPIHPHTFGQSFERIIANAGLRKIRLHDLRRTHASLALKAGVPVQVISGRLGHDSARRSTENSESFACASAARAINSSTDVPINS